MPTLLSERVVTLEFADLHKRRQLGPIRRPAAPLARAPGAHQSDILRYVALKIGQLKPNEPLEEDMPLVIALGFAWEEFLFSMLPSADWQPGELERDGIAVNCDGITANDAEYGEDVLEETKFTFKKTMTGAEFLEKQWMWLHQARAYCWCYGPRIVRWHVCHIRGDYKVFGPVHKQYVVRFSDKECEQTMVMLRNNKEAAMRAMEVQTV